MQQKSWVFAILALAIVLVTAAAIVAAVVLARDKNSSSDVLRASSLDCPQEGSLNCVPEDGRPVELSKSKSNGICTLVQTNGDFLVFVARSYSGNDWEPSAGKFSVVFDCDEEDCTTTTPLPELPTGFVYQLTSFDEPNYSSRDIAARFLEQATFGPTMDEIDKFNGSTTTSAFARWMQNQMTNVPVLSHRALFRQHLNARFEVPSILGPVTQPATTHGLVPTLRSAATSGEAVSMASTPEISLSVDH
jgi:hypothetical protein